MHKHLSIIRLLTLVVVAFLVNLVVDVVFEPPMPVRWGIALAVVLLLTAVIEGVRRRRGAERSDQGMT